MRAFVTALGILFSVVSPSFASGRAVTFAASDGINLAAEIYEAASRPAPAVVLVHMLSRSKADWDAFAGQLQEAGLTALAIDLRGHGGSSGSRGNLQDMVLDVKAAVLWLSARQGVKPGAIAIVGASLGANLAVLAAADIGSSVKALALLSPSLDYRGLRLDASTLKRTGDCPIWMSAGTQDPLSLRTLKDLSSGATGQREQRLAEGVAHGMGLLTADPEVGRGLVDWLRRSLLS